MRTIVAALLTTLTLAAEAQTFRVSGTLVDSETRQPLARAQIKLIEESREWNVITAVDGGFSFDVPQGKYQLEASHHEWGDVYGEPVPGNRSGVAVVTGPDHNTTQLLFRFRRAAAFHGKIVDERGEPLPSATIELFQQTITRGRKHLESLSHAESNDFGEYSYSRLSAGTYYLAATGMPWYQRDLVRVGTTEDSGVRNVPYGMIYFPGSSNPGGATAVVLRPGAEFEADFVLRSASGANLHLRFPESMDGGYKMYAHGPMNAETLVRTCIYNCSGVPAVAPGNYVLYFSNPMGAARIPVSINGDGDVPIEVALKPVPSLAGKVVFSSQTQRPPSPLFVNIEDQHSGKMTTLMIHADGTFSWPGAAIGQVRLHLSGSDGFFTERMSVEGAIVTNGIIDLSGGSNAKVEILASGETGTLNGFIKNEELPAPGALVVLAPSNGTSDPDRYFATHASTDGSYTFTNVPAGEYVLFTVANSDFEYASPQAVRPYLATGKHVRINGRLQ
ncbi:MAG TPA: carboxypeptidase regulatory-like domain-containing protein [Bryobacteraceae bacterium]|jgi:hypothetical protein